MRLTKGGKQFTQVTLPLHQHGKRLRVMWKLFWHAFWNLHSMECIWDDEKITYACYHCNGQRSLWGDWKEKVEV